VPPSRHAHEFKAYLESMYGEKKKLQTVVKKD